MTTTPAGVLAPIPVEHLPATQVGGGVPRRPDPRPAVKVDKLPSKVQWCDRPQYPEQIRNADDVKQVGQEVFVLDLSKADDLVKFQELLNLDFAENSHRYLLTQERRFDEKLGRFLVYAEVGVFKFRAILPKDIHGKN